MKKIATLPFVNIDSIPQLIKDFLQEKIPVFEGQLFNDKNIEEQFKLKRNSFSNEKRDLLQRVLEERNSVSDLSQKQKNALQLLKKENTFTVITGHQLNLFTGPVYFIYKILQTIKLAAYLNEKFPENYTIPVFWMASEDHDFEEINHFKTRNQYYETNEKSGGAVGNIKIEDDLFISQFETEFKDSVFGTELILLLKKAYKKGNTLAQATRILVQELFGDFGLLIIDGDHKNLKAEMKPVFKSELLHQDLLNSTTETVKFLSEKYGKVQVNPREINLFYLSETRNRIDFNGEKFVIVDTDLSFTQEEILAELENHPEKFSPNAVMRPVYQETILPNLAYIGGNAEIMYWLELKNYFKKIELPFPILIPRNSILSLTEKTVTKISNLGLSLEDLFRDFAGVTKENLLQNNDILLLLTTNQQKLENHFEELEAVAESTDKTFSNLVEAEKTRQLKSFGRMKKRLLRAEKIKQQEKLERFENLFLKVHPGKNWQERSYNFSVFYADKGKDWLQICYDGIEVQKSELLVFSI